VLRHRLVLSYEALGDNVSPDDVVGAVLARIPMPEVVLRERNPPVRGSGDDRAWAPPPR
jgi:MoxR-like ATPase